MIEHESHSHAHHTGLPWLDLIVAGSAIFISIVSLIVSIRHGHTMEKLVAANEKQVEASTLPIIRFTTGNALETLSVVHFDLRNGGTGPAIIEWFRVKWNGQPTNGPGDLLDRCCRRQTQRAGSVWQNVASGSTLPAGQSESIFQIALLTQILICIVSSIMRRGSKSRPKAATVRFLTSAGLLTSRFRRRRSRLANRFLKISAGKDLPKILANLRSCVSC